MAAAAAAAAAAASASAVAVPAEFWGDRFERPASPDASLFAESVARSAAHLAVNLHGAPSDSGAPRPPCAHPFVESWDIRRCTHCGRAVADARRVAAEQAGCDDGVRRARFASLPTVLRRVTPSLRPEQAAASVASREDRRRSCAEAAERRGSGGGDETAASAEGAAVAAAATSSSAVATSSPFRYLPITISPHARRLRRLGVRVDWLLAFTFAHDCWSWPTWRVVCDVVRPATAARRCRYAELKEVAPFAGDATVIVSWSRYTIITCHAISTGRSCRSLAIRPLLLRG